MPNNALNLHAGSLNWELVIGLSDKDLLNYIRKSERYIFDNIHLRLFFGKRDIDFLIAELKFFWTHRNRQSLKYKSKEYIKELLVEIKSHRLKQQIKTDVAIFRKELNKNYDKILLSLYLKDGARCAYCSKDRDLSIDHIVPLIKGGNNELKNLQILCRRCNSKKGRK